MGAADFAGREGGAVVFGGVVGRGGAVGTGNVRMCGLHALPESGAPPAAAEKSPRGLSSRLGPAGAELFPSLSLDGAGSGDCSGSAAARRGRGDAVGSDPGSARRTDDPEPYDVLGRRGLRRGRRGTPRDQGVPPGAGQVPGG
ncbi:hypothetical protein ABZ372_40815, partial [Streptomyces sp. NPDC005921]